MRIYGPSFPLQLSGGGKQASRTLRELSGGRKRSSNISTSQALYSQRLILPDKRTLGFSEFGHLDGYPLLFFHGWPSSRLEAWGIDSIARRRRLRIISPERPGFGLSAFRPPHGGSAGMSFRPRRIIDWPEDVSALVDHLGLDRFAILGGSGGGPFALACALKLRRQMLSSVGLMAPAGPWRVDGRNGKEEYDLTRDVMRTQRAIAFAANHFPASMRTATNGLVGLSRWIVQAEPITRRIDAWLESVGGQETEDGLTTAERRERLFRIGFEAFAQGAEGTVHEAMLLTNDFGFQFRDVDYDSIKIWHGTMDRNAPVEQIRYMAEHLPYCELKEFKDINHFNLASKLDGILAEIAGEAS